MDLNHARLPFRHARICQSASSAQVDILRDCENCARPYFQTFSNLGEMERFRLLAWAPSPVTHFVPVTLCVMP